MKFMEMLGLIQTCFSPINLHHINKYPSLKKRLLVVKKKVPTDLCCHLGNINRKSGWVTKKRFDVKLAPQLLTLLVPFLELNERTNQQKMKQAQLEFQSLYQITANSFRRTTICIFIYHRTTGPPKPLLKYIICLRSK